MGNWCAVPAVLNSTREVQRKKPNPYVINPNRESQHRPGLEVLKNPTGRNIKSRYDLGRELGHGEVSVTYLCTDRQTGEHFACKSISKKKLRTAVDIEDVRREVEIMKHLPEHPNIGKLKDTYEDSDDVHIVMELCERGELFDRFVAKRRFTERAAAMAIIEFVQILLPAESNLAFLISH